MPNYCVGCVQKAHVRLVYRLERLPIFRLTVNVLMYLTQNRAYAFRDQVCPYPLIIFCMLERAILIALNTVKRD